MEASIVVAVIAALASLGGICLNVIEKLKTNRTTADGTAAAAKFAAEESADRRRDERDEKYIKRMEEREKRAEERAERYLADLTQLRGLYNGSIARLEEVEKKLVRAQAVIEDLQAQITRNQT